MSLSLDDPVPPRISGGISGGVPSGTVAPDAPGRLGMPLSGQEAFVYLRDLGVWRDKRKAELDALDSAALSSSGAGSKAGAETLGMRISCSRSPRTCGNRACTRAVSAPTSTSAPPGRPEGAAESSGAMTCNLAPWGP